MRSLQLVEFGAPLEWREEATPERMAGSGGYTSPPPPLNGGMAGSGG